MSITILRAKFVNFNSTKKFKIVIVHIKLSIAIVPQEMFSDVAVVHTKVVLNCSSVYKSCQFQKCIQKLLSVIVQTNVVNSNCSHKRNQIS